MKLALLTRLSRFDIRSKSLSPSAFSLDRNATSGESLTSSSLRSIFPEGFAPGRVSSKNKTGSGTLLASATPFEERIYQSVAASTPLQSDLPTVRKQVRIHGCRGTPEGALPSGALPRFAVHGHLNSPPEATLFALLQFDRPNFLHDPAKVCFVRRRQCNESLFFWHEISLYQLNANYQFEV